MLTILKKNKLRYDLNKYIKNKVLQDKTLVNIIKKIQKKDKIINSLFWGINALILSSEIIFFNNYYEKFELIKFLLFFMFSSSFFNLILFNISEIDNRILLKNYEKKYLSFSYDELIELKKELNSSDMKSLLLYIEKNSILKIINDYKEKNLSEKDSKLLIKNNNREKLLESIYKEKEDV